MTEERRTPHTSGAPLQTHPEAFLVVFSTGVMQSLAAREHPGDERVSRPKRYAASPLGRQGGRDHARDLFAVNASAELDRVLHRSATINIRGENYRLKDKRKEGVHGGASPSQPRHKRRSKAGAGWRVSVGETGQSHTDVDTSDTPRQPGPASMNPISAISTSPSSIFNETGLTLTAISFYSPWWSENVLHSVACPGPGSPNLVPFAVSPSLRRPSPRAYPA
jgi:hypothetical protein